MALEDDGKKKGKVFHYCRAAVPKPGRVAYSQRFISTLKGKDYLNPWEENSLLEPQASVKHSWQLSIGRGETKRHFVRLAAGGGSTKDNRKEKCFFFEVVILITVDTLT